MVDPNLKNRCFRVLRKVSPAHGILPKSYFPPGVTLSDIPYASGGFADVWKGQQDGKPVCVKAFRTQPAANLDKVKRVCASFLLQHDDEFNLIPTRGFTVRSWGGSTFRIQMSCPSSEFWRRRPRFASQPLGYRMETFSSIFGNIRGSTDYSW